MPEGKALDDFVTLADVVVGSLPFLESDKREKIGLLAHKTWIKKQIKAIEKATAGDPEEVRRLMLEAILTSLKRAFTILDGGEVESVAELLNDRLYPGFEYLVSIPLD